VEVPDDLQRTEDPEWVDDADLTIDCDACALRDTTACRGCLVSFVLDRSPGDAVIFDAEEARAIRVLSRAGLVPDSRFEASAS
jgi:hypothetical protein